MVSIFQSNQRLPVRRCQPGQSCRSGERIPRSRKACRSSPHWQPGRVVSVDGVPIAVSNKTNKTNCGIKTKQTKSTMCHFLYQKQIKEDSVPAHLRDVQPSSQDRSRHQNVCPALGELSQRLRKERFCAPFFRNI